MKLLVLAQVPPPHHGQSAMVELLVRTLPEVRPDIELHHVNLRVSEASDDIGRWQIGKYFAAKRVIAEAHNIIEHHKIDMLYYVPAPGKRIALWRDLLILSKLRPHVKKLILHWHASGLGGWLESQGWNWERRAAQHWLGNADLSIVLGEALRADAECLSPVRTEVIRNGIQDPTPNQRQAKKPDRPLTVLFVGECSESKGIFRAIEGLREANRRRKGSVRLSVAGKFPNQETESKFHNICGKSTFPIDYHGFVEGTEKNALFERADCLIFPTTYPYETQGLVVTEALAYDLPVIITRWRAVHESLPNSHALTVEPDAEIASSIAKQLERLSECPPATGSARAYFLDHYTAERFIRQIAAAISPLMK
ncbi:MAG: hypothetical protein SynsKO_22740 [Synoicihabitans sp.]